MVRFRLYPEASLYWIVQVWPTRADMVKYLDRRSFLHSDEVGGMCNGIDTYKVQGGVVRKLRSLGEINLYRGGCSTEVIAHETTHAVIGWARRVGIDPLSTEPEGGPESDENERFCYAAGRMVRDLTNKLYRHKVWGSA